MVRLYLNVAVKILKIYVIIIKLFIFYETLFIENCRFNMSVNRKAISEHAQKSSIFDTSDFSPTIFNPANSPMFARRVILRPFRAQMSPSGEFALFQTFLKQNINRINKERAVYPDGNFIVSSYIFCRHHESHLSSIYCHKG